MLVLHDLDGDEHLFAAEHINAVGLCLVGMDNVRTTQVTTTGGQNICVRESQMDVARLRAAWELRHVAEYEGRSMSADLPIAIEMSEAGIQMRFCEHTRRAREEAQAKTKARRESLEATLRRCTTRRDQLAEQVEQQLTRPSDAQYDDQA
jgi:hypothetical protein